MRTDIDDCGRYQRLVGAIQTFDLTLRAAARRAVNISLPRRRPIVLLSTNPCRVLERFDEIGNRQRLRFTMRKLVAAMSVYQVPKILPFDPDDFNRYENVTVLHSNSS